MEIKFGGGQVEGGHKAWTTIWMWSFLSFKPLEICKDILTSSPIVYKLEHNKHNGFELDIGNKYIPFILLVFHKIYKVGRSIMVERVLDYNVFASVIMGLKNAPRTYRIIPTITINIKFIAWVCKTHLSFASSVSSLLYQAMLHVWSTLFLR